MSADQFHKLMLEESVTFQLEQDNIEKALNGLKGELIDRIKKMRVGKTDK